MWPLLMQFNPLSLLGALAPSRPAGGASEAGRATDEIDFAKLLQDAKSGELSTGRPVTVVDPTSIRLSDEQLSALSVLADQAEAAGMTRAAVLTPDGTFILDVGSRTIERAIGDEEQVLSGVDGVLRLDLSHDAESAGGGVLPPPRNLSGLNASLLRALAGESGPAAGRDDG